MNWRCLGSEIPSSVAWIIREENSVTGLITQYTYSKPSAAREKVKELMAAGHEFVIANEAEVRLMTPELLEDEEDGED